MTETHHVDLRAQLMEQALGGAVQQHTRDVIQAAARTVRRLAPKDNDISGMRENQLRNVVNVAIGASNVEEIAAFILYQMGRSTNQRQWLYGDFGKTVVEDLMTGPVREATRAAWQHALERIHAAPDISPPDEDQQRSLRDEAHIALARLYLGYLNRLFYFAERGGRDDPQGRWEELAQLIPDDDDPKEAT